MTTNCATKIVDESMLPTALTSLIVLLLDFFTYPGTLESGGKNSETLTFELRHLHAVSSSAHVVFSDFHNPDIANGASNANAGNYTRTTYSIQTRRTASYRPLSFAAFSQARTWSMKYGQSQSIPWEEDEVLGPDVESRETLLELAKMTNNAYVAPEDPAWYELDGNWTIVSRLVFMLCVFWS